MNYCELFKLCRCVFSSTLFNSEFKVRTKTQTKFSVCIHAKSLQSCPTLWDPMDCSLTGSSVYGISQARILEWVAIPFSRGSSQPRDRTWLSCTGKESAYQRRRHSFDPWVRKIPWRRKWQPTPVSLPGKSHGHRSLAVYSP